MYYPNDTFYSKDNYNSFVCKICLLLCKNCIKEDLFSCLDC